MQIAFKKGTTFIAKSIEWWTDSVYSHCELVFSNGLSFSADIEVYRTRFKTVEYDENEWDFIDISLTKEQEAHIFEWCVSEDDCKYDIIGILFTQIIPLSFESKWWWFCSENCCSALKQVGLYPDIISHHYSPGELYNLLKEK